jgi:hypothetical protein
MTAEQILAMIGQNSKLVHDIDIGDDSSDSAEMYSNSNYELKKNRNKKKNTFQQSSVNVRGQAPAFSSSPSAPSVEEDQGIPGDQTVGISEQNMGVD